jgi:DUF971 family protein
LRGWQIVGGYALQPSWGDGHGTGLYTFALLRRLGGPLTSTGSLNSTGSPSA